MTSSKISAAERSPEPPAGSYVAVREDGEYLTRWSGRWRLASDRAEAAKLSQSAAVAAIRRQISPAEQEYWWVCPVSFLPAKPAEHPFILLHASGVMLTRDEAGMWGTTREVLLAAHMDSHEADECLAAMHAETDAEPNKKLDTKPSWRMVTVGEYLHPHSISQAQMQMLVARISGAVTALTCMHVMAQSDTFCCTALCRNTELRATQQGLSLYPPVTPEKRREAVCEHEKAEAYLRQLLAMPLGEVTLFNTNPYAQIEDDLGQKQ